MENILDTDVPEICVDVMSPTTYRPEPDPGPKTVGKRMTSWYDWLVSHVPETIRRPVSDAYKKMKDKVMSLFERGYRVKPGRRLLNNVVGHHEILPLSDTTSPQDFLNEIRTTVVSFFRENPQNKVQISLICEMMRTDPATGNIVSMEQAAFNSMQEAVYDSTDLEAVYEKMVSKILELFSAYLKKGSGWTLKGVVRLDFTHAKNKPLKGSSHTSLPKGLGRGKVINMKNEDNQCFKWAVTRGLNPVERNPQRITEELERQAEELNWDGIKFPTPCEERMYKKFEENNDVSLLVFGHVGSDEDLRIIPL